TLVFLIRPFDFWAMLASATFILLIIAVLVSREKLALHPSILLILYGIVTAVLLYGLFYFGFELTKSNPIFSQGISQVYGLRSNESRWLIAMLLIFPIGPGEELYWRGLIQRTFAEKKGSNAGLVIASLAYALVHLPTLNPPLILTALIGGLVWGSLYKFTKSLVPGIVSHVLWDLMIFVLLPFT
ncbi:MAG: type II CAAX endopeptidase family protein, partial [Candidatus Bathyarchaeia archaeon]